MYIWGKGRAAGRVGSTFRRVQEKWPVDNSATLRPRDQFPPAPIRDIMKPSEERYCVSSCNPRCWLEAGFWIPIPITVILIETKLFTSLKQRQW